MKQAEIIVGLIYTVRISGKLVPAKVLRKNVQAGRSYYNRALGCDLSSRGKTTFTILNLATGRETTVTAAKLREVASVYRIQTQTKPSLLHHVLPTNPFDL